MTEEKIKQAIADAQQQCKDGLITRRERNAKLIALRAQLAKII